MIVFCGYANRDLTVSVPTLPGAGARVQATEVRERDGGMGANAAVAAARLGADARFAGAVGPDARSDAFLRALTEDGVDVSLTVRTAILTTAVVLLTPDGERAIISEDDGLDATLVGEAATTEGADWLYLDGYRFPAAHAVLANRSRPPLVVDLDGCASTPAALGALSLAEHAVIGRPLATELLGGPDALAEAARGHRVHLVVTDGPRGWTLHLPNGERHESAALPVAAVDTTGAGDCFVGAYCAELDRGADPLAAARFASVAAGLSCTRAGARDGMPDRAAVLARIDQPAEQDR